jgi:hypothetical protein
MVIRILSCLLIHIFGFIYIYKASNLTLSVPLSSLYILEIVKTYFRKATHDRVVTSRCKHCHVLGVTCDNEYVGFGLVTGFTGLFHSWLKFILCAIASSHSLQHSISRTESSRTADPSPILWCLFSTEDDLFPVLQNSPRATAMASLDSQSTH